MSKIVSVVGIVLIIAAGALTAVSASKEDLLKSKKELCAKYTKNAEAALAQKDFEKATKFAKLAIKVDPENKIGYATLTKIAEAKCSGNAPAANSATTATKAKPKAAAAQEEELGC